MENDSEKKREENGRGSDLRFIGKVAKNIPWADGVVVIKRGSTYVALPIKKSKKGGYYAALTWRPIMQGAELAGLENCVILRGLDIQIGDKYISIKTKRSWDGVWNLP